MIPEIAIPFSAILIPGVLVASSRFDRLSVTCG